MKLAAVLTIGALGALSADASVFVTDTFETYNLGNLAGQGSWTAHGGAGQSPVQVVADNGPTFPGNRSARFSHGSGTREDVNTPLGTTMKPGDVFYAGFDVKVEGPIGLAEYFAHFRDNATFFSAKVGVEPAGNAFKFTLTQAGSTPTARTAGTYNLGQWYHLVAAYTFDSGLSRVWIDQPTEGTPDISDTWFASTAVTNYALRQGSNGTAMHTLDNLIAGTSYGEVVPEPAALLLMAAGALLRRRR